MGKDLEALLGLPEPDGEASRNEFRHRFLALAIEAFRRDEITRSKLDEPVEMVDASSRKLDDVLKHGGFGTADRAGDSQIEE